MGSFIKGKAAIVAASVVLATGVLPASRAFAAEGQGGATYVVVSGDSLSLIAARVYKDAAKWINIYRANLDRITDPALISVGTILRLPDPSGQVPDSAEQVTAGGAKARSEVTLAAAVRPGQLDDPGRGNRRSAAAGNADRPGAGQTSQSASLTDGVPPAGSGGPIRLIADQENAPVITDGVDVRNAGEPLRINLVTGGEFAPFVDETLPEKGMLTELVSAAFRSIGYDVEVDFLGWKYGLDATRNGQFAGIFPYQKGEQSDEEFLYSSSLYRVLMRLFVLNDSNITYNQPSSLHGLTLCRPAGYALDDLQQLLDQELIILKTPRSLETCFNHLVRSQVDAVSVNDVVGKAMLHEIGLAKEVRALETATSIGTLHLMLPLYYADSETLLYEFDQSLQVMKETGVYKVITSRHLRQYYENLRSRPAATATTDEEGLRRNLDSQTPAPSSGPGGSAIDAGVPSPAFEAREQIDGERSKGSAVF